MTVADVVTIFLSLLFIYPHIDGDEAPQQTHCVDRNPGEILFLSLPFTCPEKQIQRIYNFFFRILPGGVRYCVRVINSRQTSLI